MCLCVVCVLCELVFVCCGLCVKLHFFVFVCLCVWLYVVSVYVYEFVCVYVCV